MATRLEGLVECVNAMCDQESYALMVLGHSGKDRDEAIALQVVQGAAFEKHIGLVNQENESPGSG